MTDTDSSTPPGDPSTLRLAIFSDSVPERNGAGAYYHDLKEQLSPKLEAIELFQPIGKHPLIKYALPLPGDSTQKIITPNVPRLWSQYKTFNPHLVVAVTPGPFGILGMLLARRFKAGFITAFHTHFEGLVKMYGDTAFFRFSAWYLKQTNKILIKRSATVLVNNDDLIPTVESLGARNVDIMGTPLAGSILNPTLVEPAPCLKRILFAGRLAPEKNLPVVLEAASALPEVEFVMAGEGPLRKEMEKAAESIPNLRLTGWLDRDSLRRELDNTSLLLLPSHMETFGTVALEALARGRPALVSENAGIHQWTILKDALFTWNANESIVDALRRIQALPAVKWAEMAVNGRKAAEALNEETIDQWAGFVSQYSKPVKE
jgi:glycosyltransferase involved in cell wall biosynthesis